MNNSKSNEEKTKNVSMEEENKARKDSQLGLKLVIAGIVLFAFCVGVAFLWYNIFQKDKKVVTTLTIALKDKGRGVDVESLVPQNDRDAKNVPAYSFDISNTGDSVGRYEVLLEDSIKRDSDGYASEEFLTRDQLKYELILNDKAISSGLLSTIKNNVLDSRTIDAGKINTYKLRIWVPFDAEDWQNKTYHYKVAVNSINEGE